MKSFTGTAPIKTQIRKKTPTQKRYPKKQKTKQKNSPKNHPQTIQHHLKNHYRKPRDRNILIRTKSIPEKLKASD